jgi:hypothetical protein
MTPDEIIEWFDTLPKQSWSTKEPNYKGYMVFYEYKPRYDKIEVTVYWVEKNTNLRGDADCEVGGDFDEAVKEAVKNGCEWTNETGLYKDKVFVGTPEKRTN